MKLLALTKYDSLGASSRMRILQYIPFLKEHDFTVDVKPLFTNKYVESLQTNRRNHLSILHAYFKRISLVLSLRNYDVVWIEKEALPWAPYFLEKILFLSVRPYILDYDDAVFHWYDQSRNSFIKFFLGSKHRSLIGNAKLVIVGNSYLERYANRVSAQKVLNLPTSIDYKKYSKFNFINTESTSAVKIGWIGQQSTAYNLNPLKEIFEELILKDLMSLTLIGIDGKSLNLPVNALPWSETTEVNLISKFDIGIMPLQDGPFERGKCGYKLIQYMACGIPVIGSGVGENKNIIEHGKNGFIANSPSEWMKYLLVLINDPNLRKSMGSEGRKKVINRYTTQATAPKLVNSFREI